MDEKINTTSSYGEWRWIVMVTYWQGYVTMSFCFLKHNDQPLLRQDSKCRLRIWILNRTWTENLNTAVLFSLATLFHESTAISSLCDKKLLNFFTSFTIPLVKTSHLQRVANAWWNKTTKPELRACFLFCWSQWVLPPAAAAHRARCPAAQ